MDQPAAPATDDRLPTLVWVIAAAFVVIELAFSAGYGFQQDELYFIQASRHLAFGYVDQPPIAPLLTRLATMIGGTNPTAVRTLPALEGGAIIVLAARQAAIFGAGRIGAFRRRSAWPAPRCCSAPPTSATPRHRRC